MPTFKAYRGGVQVKEIVGADKSELNATLHYSPRREDFNKCVAQPSKFWVAYVNYPLDYWQLR